MLFDIAGYEKRAKEALTGLMIPFGQGVNACPLMCQEVYGCTLLRRTLANKTVVKGIIVAHYWWDWEETRCPFKEAEDYTAKEYQADEDATLAALFNRVSPWPSELDAQNGWVATNALWGRCPPKGIKGDLGPERYQAGFTIWGRIVEELIGLNPDLKIVLAGGWAKTSRMLSDEEYSAAEFCMHWDRWLRHSTQTRFTSDTRTILKRISVSNARFFTRHHPSKWMRFYRKYPPPP